MITAFGGAAHRDRHGIWRHTDTDEHIPGATDMTLTRLYPDLVIINNEAVLVPDALVRDNEDLSWVRDVADGPTSVYDRERGRSGVPTLGWSDVWPVPLDEWERRDRECRGIWIDDWRPGEPLPRP